MHIKNGRRLLPQQDYILVVAFLRRPTRKGGSNTNWAAFGMKPGLTQ
jgi:hypothetical protein